MRAASLSRAGSEQESKNAKGVLREAIQNGCGGFLEFFYGTFPREYLGECPEFFAELLRHGPGKATQELAHQTTTSE